MAKIEAICVSETKGVQKSPTDAAEFQADCGIVGDAHTGVWHRQVSLLAAEDIAAVREVIPDISYGDFAENVVVSDVDLKQLGLGSRLRIGDQVILAITQIGKECHTPCRIGQITGDCIMPRLGLFARVETGGNVRTGDAVEVLEVVSPAAVQAVVLTISDSCAAGDAQDTAGPATAKMLAEQIDAHVYRTEIIPDEQAGIAARLRHYCDGHSIDLVVTVGGTGFSPRDVTPEATREVAERLTPGLDEAMRAASMEKTPRAMLSRAASGIRKHTLIVNLPGSERAASENLAAIMASLPHAIAKLRDEDADCGRPAQKSGGE